VGLKIATANGFLGHGFRGMYGTFEVVIIGEKHTAIAGDLMHPTQSSHTIPSGFPNTPEE
jgi:hypothetical protein